MRRLVVVRLGDYAQVRGILPGKQLKIRTQKITNKDGVEVLKQVTYSGGKVIWCGKAWHLSRLLGIQPGLKPALLNPEQARLVRLHANAE